MTDTVTEDTTSGLELHLGRATFEFLASARALESCSDRRVRVGLALFLVALARKNDGLKRTSLALFFVVATVAIATYITGNGAESVIKGRPDVSQVAIRAHEDAALLAFTFMEVTGFFAWLALWQWRRVPHLARWNVPVVLLLAVVTFALMAKAATLGGEITHSEILSAQVAIDDGRRIFDSDARRSRSRPANAARGR